MQNTMRLSSGAPITLVVPVYNRPELIGPTIESALNQTRPFARIIVVDDGSTDSTAEVLKEYASHIDVITTPNQGVQMARNAGIRAAQTEWVALCDSDDLLMPDYVAELSPFLAQQARIDIVYCNFMLFDAHGDQGDKFSQGPDGFFSGAKLSGAAFVEIPNLYERTLAFQPFFPTGSVMKRSFFEQLGGYDPLFKGVGGEDWEFLLRAVEAGQAGAYSKPLARVRKHEGNDSLDSARVNFGDATILAHALQHHKGAQQCRVAVQHSMEKRLMAALDGFYAAGKFESMRETVDRLKGCPLNFRQLFKVSILNLPKPFRNWAWQLSQGKNASASPHKQASVMVIEPTWNGSAHLPANLGLLRVVHEAYPDAQISFVGGKEQIALMKQIAPPEVMNATRFFEWETKQDKDAWPTDGLATMRRLKAIGPGLVSKADKLVLSSFTSTALMAVTWMGGAHKACAVLHGNAGELKGWRSKNPVLRAFDLTGTLKRFCASGGKAIVMEDRILASMREQYPWLATHLACLSHPLLPEEAVKNWNSRDLKAPIKIGFAGLASQAKGFTEFLELANVLRSVCPGKFDFRAVGMVTNECRHLDQSALSTKAELGWPRGEFVEKLRELDFIFTWHKDEYYGDAASGVVYDAVNQCIPLLGRRRVQLAAWVEAGLNIGHTFETLSDLIDFLRKADMESLIEGYSMQRQTMHTLQQQLSLVNLGAQFRLQFPLL